MAQCSMGGSNEEIELQDRKGTATYSISITDGDTNTITPSPSSHPSSLLVRRQKYNSNISNNSDNNINNNNCNNNNNNNNNISNNTLNNSQNDNGNDNNNNDNKKLLVEDSFNECRGKRKRKRKVCSVFGEERFNDKIRNKVRVIMQDFLRGVAFNLGWAEYPDHTPWLYATVQGVAWGAMYWGLAWVGLQFIVTDFSSFWPPNGAYASALLTLSPRGRRLTPFIMIISIFTVNEAWGRTREQSLGFVGVNTFECLFASSLIRGFARAMSGKSRLNLLHRNDLAAIFLGMCVGCIISANFGTLLTQLDPNRSYGDTYIKWLGRNVVGLALIVPLSLSIPPFHFRRLHHTVYNWVRLNTKEVLRGSIMFFALILVPSICTWVVSGTTLSTVVALYVSCPLILYSGAIYGSFGASFSVLVVSLTTVTALLLFGQYDVRPLLEQVSNISVQGQFIWMQLLTLLLISMALVFVLVLTERDRARALIEKKVQERTEALTEALSEIEVARARAETADADKAVFFSFLCHELRNPLHVVSNMAGFLEEKMQNQDLSQIRAIKLSSGYMLALVSDVLDMGRFEAGRVVLENISVDIHSLLQNNFMCAEGLIKMHSLTFETHVDPTLPKFLATDPTRLQQILNNLVSNAFKFTHKGGNIKIEVEVVRQFSQTAPPKPNQAEEISSSEGLTIHHPAPSPASLGSPKEIEKSEEIEKKKEMEEMRKIRMSDPSSEREKGGDGEVENWVMVRISVSDTGIGIEPDIIDKIFRPYAQATISTVREYGGSGLGLAITNQIVHLMKGKLTVDSEVGKGSTFSFTIPLQITDAPLANHNSITPTNHALLQSLYTHSLASNPTSPVAAQHMPKDPVAEIAFISSFRDLKSNINDIIITDSRIEDNGSGNSINYNNNNNHNNNNNNSNNNSNTNNTIIAINIEDENISPPSSVIDNCNSNATNISDCSDIDTTNNNNNYNNNNNNNHNNINNNNNNNHNNNHNSISDDDSANINNSTLSIKRILVVDDSHMNRMVLITMIKKILVQDTFVIDVAVNGLDAVNIVTSPATPRYDIIFMDINMPVMDGWTACEQIQTHGITSPIIVNTANKISGTDTTEKLHLSGVSGALAKPFSKSDIHELFIKFQIV